jgi:hypothetical protein
MNSTTEKGKTVISTQALESFLTCPTKALLASMNEPEDVNEYDTIRRSIQTAFRAKAKKAFMARFPGRTCLVAEALTRDHLTADGDAPLIFGASIEAQHMRATTDALVGEVFDPKDRGVTYEPALFCPANSKRSADCLLLAFAGIAIGKFQKRTPSHGLLMYGDRLALTRIRIDPYVPRVLDVVAELQTGEYVRADVYCMG